MKTSLSSAALAGLAYAGGDVGPWSYSTKTKLNMSSITGVTNPSFSWSMTVWTAYDEDYGDEYLRFEHELTADIKATDEVHFEVGFRSKEDPWTNKKVIAEDGAVCKMTQSTQDTQFWTQSSEDKYYYCAGDSDCYFLAFKTDNVYTAGDDPGSSADWTNPHDDDDEDDPFCTPHSNPAFACSKIKCRQQRLLVTEDEYDFNFLPTKAADDELTIQRGRAMLGINEAGCSTYCAYSSFYEPPNSATEWKFTVKDSAVYVASMSMAALSATLLFAF